ncbi:hypothetical protein M7I_0496 [Glarea lozoyensis 74030]|uniref:Uncharacterized protein n=1 Tax=Glarea lozoyensis (strain ATCC 74030 / MF5533) TaxID=1104152 RepID=H0EDP1_GLAL7|nr:hypothetical protein M7I_0496 [Glarea lozoyensis 74030]
MGSVTNDIQQELRDISERLKTMENDGGCWDDQSISD